MLPAFWLASAPCEGSCEAFDELCGRIGARALSLSLSLSHSLTLSLSLALSLNRLTSSAGALALAVPSAFSMPVGFSGYGGADYR